jgi:hypothetical protein
MMRLMARTFFETTHEQDAQEEESTDAYPAAYDDPRESEGRRRRSVLVASLFVHPGRVRSFEHGRP